MSSEDESSAPQIVPEIGSRPPVVSEPAETHFLKWVLLGSQGIRAGWSAACFVLLYFILQAIFGAVLITALHINPADMKVFTPNTALLLEILQFLPIAGAAALCAIIERRSILDYNLTGPRRALRFLTGIGGGFVALSLLAAVLYAGGWLRFGALSLSGIQIAEFGGLWGLVFLLTGFAEEGIMRCYLLFTLTRGINYWWALGAIAAFSLFAALNPDGNGNGGVYAAAALGLLPCLFLHRKHAPSAGFWEAAWVTSTLFGYIHTFNHGETWLGIFSAALIGFVFCASVYLTGSAWWAIGFHASWDWAQTFFYGTADSGLIPRGHFLTTAPAGAVTWSGGNAGPEGSLLVIPIILLVLAALVLVYGRKSRAESSFPVGRPQLS